MKIVSGRTGSPHVTSQQFRQMLEGIIGQGSYIITSGENLKPELSSNNLLKIRSGMMAHHGCISCVDIGTYDEVTLTNGSQGMKRIDLIVNRYTRNAETEVENCSWKVIQGKPVASNPAVPAYTSGNLQNGDLVDECPAFEVHYDGINVTEVKSLLSVADGLSELSSNLANIKADLIKANNSLNVIGTEYWSGVKNNYSYSKKETWVNNVSTVTIPAGTYIFTLKATPCAKGQSYDAFVMGITGINSTRTQNTFYMNFGNGFYPILTSTCIEKVPAGTYGIAFWSSQPRNVNGIELRAIRIK